MGKQFPFVIMFVELEELELAELDGVVLCAKESAGNKATTAIIALANRNFE
jgi:hypothetical protein